MRYAELGLALVTLFFSLGIPVSGSADPYADTVVADEINTASCGGDCAGSASEALGPADGLIPGATLGDLGSITLGFVDNICFIDDTSAPDIKVTELGASVGGTAEGYFVSVGLSGGMITAGEVFAAGGTNQIDLTPLLGELGGAVFDLIRITDADSLDDTNLFYEGADIDGVECLVLSPPTLTVSIDIKPGSDPNSINLSSAGVIPVAILSSETFDAADVDPDTIVVAGAIVRVVGKGDRHQCGLEDVNDDAHVDLVCHISNMTDFLTVEGESVAVLEAELFDGTPIRGVDSVRIVPD